MATVANRTIWRELPKLLRGHAAANNAVAKDYSTKGAQPELFPARLILPEKHGYIPTLSPSDITAILTTNETCFESRVPGHHVIKGFDSNQLPSNYPVEDRRNHAHLTESDATVFAVYDGHGGAACAQAVSERLLNYVAIALLSPEKLEKFSRLMRTDKPMEILQWHHNHNDYFSDEMSVLYSSSLQKFVVETLSTSGFMDDEVDFTVSGALKSAFDRLDSDICSEALPMAGSLNMSAFHAAMSGACASVAHIKGMDLHVATSGDTRVVLGQREENGEWVSKALSKDQNFDNQSEVERVRNSHPKSETSFVLKSNRLLGQLIPLRAFGDVRFKWSLRDLKTVVNILDNAYSQTIIPVNYYTPPYLIATPEVTNHRISKKDQFMILATDGLWEMIPEDKAVKLVGNYIEGKETVDHFSVPDPEMSLSAINDLLRRRKLGLALKSADTNAATHLIRNALGPEHKKVSEMLTLPKEISRYYRDDITVTVVFFDTDYVDNYTDEAMSAL